VSLEVQINDVDHQLSIKAAGEYSLSNLQTLFDRVKEVSEKLGCREAMLDLTEVTGTIPVLDMLVLGEHCARIWKQPFRIAIVSPAGGLDRFFENVGRNRGLQVTVVPNQRVAIDWLSDQR
jgi:hypothetical protein